MRNDYKSENAAKSIVILMRSNVLALVLFVGMGCRGEPGTERPATDAIHRVDPMTSTTLQGVSVQIPDPCAPTVVEFWATWCAPCQEILKKMNTQARSPDLDGIKFYAIALDDNPVRVLRMTSTLGLSLPVVLDPAGQFQGEFGVTEIPVGFLIDGSGKVVSRFTTNTELESRIAEIPRAARRQECVP